MRAVLAGLLSGLLLVACAEELTVEQQIIATLRKMEVAAEAAEHFEFMTYVADTFDGQYGSMDKRAFHRFMIYQINQHRRLQAQLFPIRVSEPGEGQAVANFRLLVTGGGSLLPDRGQMLEVETGWLLDDGDWLLNTATWEPIDLPDIPSVIEYE